MTRAKTSLDLQITPMQLPEALPQVITKLDKQSQLDVARNALEAMLTSREPKRVRDLVVYPGEDIELLLELKNKENKPIYLNIEIESEFPREWCYIKVEKHYISPFTFQLWRSSLISFNQLGSGAIFLWWLGLLEIFIPSKGWLEITVHFRVPEDFFESNQLLKQNKPVILDYTGRIDVRYTDNPSPLFASGYFPELATSDFQLYIRPRSLYLDFLPDIYREIDFIGRFLKIFEETFEPAVQQLEALWAYLDPLTAPEAILPFLAHWVGWQDIPDLPLNFSLSQERQRRLIRRAVELYGWRGTKKGLRYYLHLYTGLPLDEDLPDPEKHIYIQEVFGQGLVIGKTRLQEHPIIGRDKPYHFLVHLRFDHPLSSEEKQQYEELSQRIIDQEKPAFCTYNLYLYP